MFGFFDLAGGVGFHIEVIRGVPRAVDRDQSQRENEGRN